MVRALPAAGFFMGAILGLDDETDKDEGDDELDADRSAGAPYLARQMSCLRSMNTGG